MEIGAHILGLAAFGPTLEDIAGPSVDGDGVEHCAVVHDVEEYDWQTVFFDDRRFDVKAPFCCLSFDACLQDLVLEIDNRSFTKLDTAAGAGFGQVVGDADEFDVARDECQQVFVDRGQVPDRNRTVLVVAPVTGLHDRHHDQFVVVFEGEGAVIACTPEALQGRNPVLLEAQRRRLAVV